MNKEEITWLFKVFNTDEKDIEETLNHWLRVEVVLSILNLRGEKSVREVVREGRELRRELLKLIPPTKGEEK